MLLCILLLGLVSCSTINSKGIMVDVKEKMTSDESSKHKRIGEVACFQNYFMVTSNYNRRLCIDSLRNSAAELGGDFIVIEQEKKLPGALSTGCELKAVVYKKITAEI
jgi:hypothetical protein